MDAGHPRFRLEPLTATHAVASFQCEDDELNEYIRSEALADLERNVANVFVEIDIQGPATANVAGHFALRAHALRIDEDYFEDWEASEDAGANYPLAIEVPLVELMWIARDVHWKGAGVGETLLFDAITLAAEAAERIGFIGLYLRATTNSARFFKQYPFEPFLEHPTYDGQYYIMPTKVLRAIAQAIKDA